jgi:S-layer protein
MSSFLIYNDDARVSNMTVATLGVAPGASYLPVIRSIGVTAAVDAMITISGKTTAAAMADAVVANLGLSGDVASAARQYLVDITFAGPRSAWASSLVSTMDAYITLNSNPVYGADVNNHIARINAAVTYSAVASNNSTDLAVLAAAISGGTFVLTTGTDNIPGMLSSKGTNSTSLNDTIDAAFNVNSWTLFDKIDGGLGIDTMNVVTTGTTVPDGTIVTNVETLSIGTTGAGYTINSSGFTGLRDLSLRVVNPGPVNVTAGSTTAISVEAAGTSDVDINGGSGALKVVAGSGKVSAGATAVASKFSSATITGGGDGNGTDTIFIQDRSGTQAATGSTLKTVTLDGAQDDTLIVANGLATLNLKALKGASGVGDVTIQAAQGARDLTINLNGVDAGAAGATAATTLTLTDNTATTLRLVSATAASSDLSVNAGGATAAFIQATAALQMDNLVASSAATLDVSGSAAVVLSGLSLTSSAVITSTSSAGVTISSELSAGQQFVGTSSSGNDIVALASGVNRTITLGAGNDQAIYGGALGTDGQVDGGIGDDTIVMSGAEADAADVNSFFNSRWKNFEILGIESGANVTLDMQGLANLSRVSTQGSTLVINNIASAGTLTLTGANTVVEVNVAAAKFSDTDTFNVHLAGSTGAKFGTVSLPSVETVALVLGDAGSGPLPATQSSFTMQATGAKTLTVSGNHGVTITNNGNTAITSFNASGVTANDGSDTPANLGVTFYSANTTASAVVNITGGEGADVLGGNSATIDQISGGAGDDRIIGDVNAEVQSFTITTKANATGSLMVLVLGNAVVLAGAADTDLLDTATRIVSAINSDPVMAGRVVASNANGASATVTLTYAESLGNVATAGGIAALGGNTVTATPVAVLTDGAVNSRADVLTGGAGVDTFLLAAGSTNTVANADTITDLNLGTANTSVDILTFGNSGAVRSVVSITAAQQTDINAASTLAGAVDVALLAINVDGATGMFSYAGNTYVLHNGDGNSTYNPTADYLIKVTGVTGTLDVGDISLV